MSAGIVTKLLKTTRNKKKEHDKNFMLARSKLNSIESKISEGLINSEISHENFTTIINEGKDGLQQLLMKKKTIVNLKKALE